MRVSRNLLWSLAYDEESYHKTFLKTQFSKYMSQLLSNKYFPQFQAQAAQQLKEQQYWNDRCWALLQFFEFLNQLFEIRTIDNKIGFIEDNILRKTLGQFRLWIDLERIYLVCFLKMDRVKFQENRIFMTLFRTVKYCFFFFTQYQLQDFQPSFIIELTKGLHYLKVLKQCSNQECKDVVGNVIKILSNFVSNKPIQQTNKDSVHEKRAYQKITDEYSSILEVESRLIGNIQYNQKLKLKNEISRLANLKISFEVTEPLYDPLIRIMREFQRTMKQNSQTFDQAKVQAIVEDYKQKTKERPTGENVYSSLMRIGHNPYDSSNFQIYGELLGIDISKKKELQQIQANSQPVLLKQSGKQIYYSNEFIGKITGLDNRSAKVVKEDLASIQQKSRDEQFLKQMELSSKIANPRWGYTHGSMVDKKDSAILSTASKDLQNNMILRDNQQDPANMRINIIKSLLQKFNSGTLTSISQKIKSADQVPKNYLSLKKPGLKQKDKLDHLRFVMNLGLVETKIKNLVQQKQAPSHYPRHYEDFRQFSHDIEKERQNYNRILDLKFNS